MWHFNVQLHDRQELALKCVSERTDTTASELVRKALDYCYTQPKVVNELFPHFSGQIKISS